MGRKLKPLSDQTIVVTGASSGIGLITARKAARAGARVLLVARNGPVLAAIRDELAAEGCAVDYAVADVGEAEQLHAAAAKAVASFGGIDTWANVAGVAIYAPLMETPPDEHERLFRTNYWGVVNGASAALPHLRLSGGALVTVGSVVSDFGTPILGAYAASKHAAKGYLDSLRIELLAERAPVSVTLIKPAGIGTPLPEHAANHLPHAAKAPPPAYAPGLVADAILHAAQHPRREIIVGGMGALQILAATTAPHLLDRVSALVIPLLMDPRRPPAPAGNLWAASFPPGEERSPHEGARRASVYTAATLHRPLAAGLAVAGAALLALALARRVSR